MNNTEIRYKFPGIYTKASTIAKPVGVVELVCPYLVMIRYPQSSFIQNTLKVFENNLRRTS